MPCLAARPKPASQPFFTPQPSTLWDSSEGKKWYFTVSKNVSNGVVEVLVLVVTE
jgi:hypothetical protein